MDASPFEKLIAKWHFHLRTTKVLTHDSCENWYFLMIKSLKLLTLLMSFGWLFHFSNVKVRLLTFYNEYTNQPFKTNCLWPILKKTELFVHQIIIVDLQIYNNRALLFNKSSVIYWFSFITPYFWFV